MSRRFRQEVPILSVIFFFVSIISYLVHARTVREKKINEVVAKLATGVY